MENGVQEKQEMVNDRSGYELLRRKDIREILNAERINCLLALDQAGAKAIDRVIRKLNEKPEYLIRCGNCAHAAEHKREDGLLYCTCEFKEYPVEYDDYCAWAEEKE